MIAAALAAATLALAPAQPLHALVVRLSPEYDVATIDREVALADAFFQRSSFGRVSLEADVTPVIQGFVVPNACFTHREDVRGLGEFSLEARRAAAATGADLSKYDRFVFVSNAPICGSGGLGIGDDVLLAGTGFEAGGLVHELGHTLGLPHAGSAKCPTCKVAAYGDTFSPMGHGINDFSAWEKLRLGWLDRVLRVSRGGRYPIGPSDAAGDLPQALVARTRVGELWIDRVQTDWLVVRSVRNGRTVMLASGRRQAVVPHAARVRIAGDGIELTLLRR